MKETDCSKKEGKVKKLIKGLFEKIDEKMKEKAKSPKGCCSSNSKDNSCCN